MSNNKNDEKEKIDWDYLNTEIPTSTEKPKEEILPLSEEELQSQLELIDFDKMASEILGEKESNPSTPVGINTSTSQKNKFSANKIPKRQVEPQTLTPVIDNTTTVPPTDNIRQELQSDIKKKEKKKFGFGGKNKNELPKENTPIKKDKPKKSLSLKFNRNKDISEEENIFIQSVEDANPNQVNKKKNKSILKSIIWVALGLASLVFAVGAFNLIIGDQFSEQTKPVEPPLVIGNETNGSTDTLIPSGEDEIINILNNMIQDIDSNSNQGYDLPEVNSSDNYSLTMFEEDKYGISFKYPSHWQEIYEYEAKSTSENVHNLIMLSAPFGSNVIDNMRISVEELPKSMSAKKYVEETEIIMSEIFPKFQSINTGELTVSGREAPTRIYRWVPEEEIQKSPHEQEWQRIQQYQTYVMGQSKMYVVTFTCTEATFSKNYDKYNEILASLTLGD